MKRRNFLKTASAGVALTAITGKLIAQPSSFFNVKHHLKEFGLQLYTVRDVIGNDPKGVLKQVAAMGYKHVESFEGPKGMFWGMKNTEFKKYMDDLGMKIISSHCSIEKDFERKANEAAEIGMEYLIDPWVGPQKSIDMFKQYADKFNERGEVCKKAGLRFAYHNHDYPFVAVDGQLPLDVMIQNTDPNLVDFEMDIYWVVTAGADPIAWFNKYPGRFRLCHIKDRKKNAPLSDKNASCVAGKGEIDFAKIIDLGNKKGLKYYIVEQENYDNMTSLEAAKENADYLKKLKI